MKKLTLIVIAATIVSFGAQGQALVDFRNSGSSMIRTNSVVGGVPTGLMTGPAGSFFFALFYSTTATTVNGSSAAIIPTVESVGNYVWNDTNWHFAGTGLTYIDNGNTFYSSGYATNNVNGRFMGLTADAVGGLAAGGTAQFVVIGWSANIGTTWQQLQTFLTSPTQIGWVGESAVSSPVITGDNGFQPEPMILNANDPMSGGIPGFTLGLVSVVPEPSTMALAGLGGLSLWLFRRRK